MDIDPSQTPITSVMTSSVPLELQRLPSGRTGVIVHTVSYGDVGVCLLLVVLIAMQAVQMWRTRRDSSI